MRKPEDLIQATQQLIDNGTIKNSTAATTITELIRLFEKTNQRFSRILKQSDKMSATIAEQKDILEKTLDQLKRSQDQLIQSEKLAALGKLVAGDLLLLEPNSYVAVVEESPEVVLGVGSAREEASYHVILGKW